MAQAPSHWFTGCSLTGSLILLLMRPRRRLLLLPADGHICCVLQDLFDDVHNKLRSGRPGFHRGSYQVQENHYHNIPASKEGEVRKSRWSELQCQQSTVHRMLGLVCC